MSHPIEDAAVLVAEPASDTKSRLLRVAERLFAEHGFDGVSVRQLTAAAGVNLAAVNYHFGSKEGLLAAIFEERCRPMNEERLRRLGDCAERANRAPMLEQIIEAFIAPALASTADRSGGRAAFTRLRATLSVEHNEIARALIARYFDATSQRFVAALARAVPHLSRSELYWRFHFLLGALYYSMINPSRIAHLSDGLCDAGDVEAVLTRMVPFIAAGFRAPSLDRADRKRARRGRKKA
ncbi:MAG TPA: TetR family transcriptional regulator [Stellaceae bacterium]|nr:TetR family transcriptional regulator [Stellaceae bacterium]